MGIQTDGQAGDLHECGVYRYRPSNYRRNYKKKKKRNEMNNFSCCVTEMETLSPLHSFWHLWDHYLMIQCSVLFPSHVSYVTSFVNLSFFILPSLPGIREVSAPPKSNFSEVGLFLILWGAACTFPWICHTPISKLKKIIMGFLFLCCNTTGDRGVVHQILCWPGTETASKVCNGKYFQF